jgi:hypothetical protein
VCTPSARAGTIVRLGRPTLDAEYGIRAARSLFVDRHGESSSVASSAYGRRVDETRARFPLRSSRGLPGRRAPDLTNVYVVEYSSGADPAEVAARFDADPDVGYATPDYTYSIDLIPSDPFFSSTTATRW